MAELDNNEQEEQSEQREHTRARSVITKYSRPIKFVSECTETLDNDKKELGQTSSGDEIASFYRSIVTESPEDKKAAEHNTKEISPNNTWWCDSCNLSVPLEDYKRHIQGTAHMVSSQINTKPIPDPLLLNGKNVGFQMMKTQGWKYEDGLGPEGQGRRLPIATVLKQDRLGIGHKEVGRKAVTHKYSEIERKAVLRQRMEAANRKDAGKEIARKAKAETERRNAILRYMKE